MTPESLQAFAAHIKLALSPALLSRYVAGRAAQGVGGAARVGKALTQAVGTTSRQVVQGLPAVERMRLRSLGDTGAATRRMQATLSHPAPAQARQRILSHYEQGAMNPALRQVPTTIKSRSGEVIQKRHRMLAGADVGPTGMGVSMGALPTVGPVAGRPGPYIREHMHRVATPAKMVDMVPPSPQKSLLPAAPTSAGQTVASRPSRKAVTSTTALTTPSRQVGALAPTTLRPNPL